MNQEKLDAELQGAIETANRNLIMCREQNPMESLPECSCWIDKFFAGYTSEELQAAEHILALLFTISQGEIGVEEMGKAMAHFDACLIERNYPRLLIGEKLGATGKFPQGKVNESDEGELALAVSADKNNGLVLLRFGTPVTWMGMSADDAKALALVLSQKADDLPSSENNVG